MSGDIAAFQVSIRGQIAGKLPRYGRIPENLLHRGQPSILSGESDDEVHTLRSKDKNLLGDLVIREATLPYCTGLLCDC